MEIIASVRGLMPHVFKWMNPKDKKALSETCKSLRSSYMVQYFPEGLCPIKMQLELSNSCHKNSFCVCGKRSSTTIQIPGMKKPGYIGMLSHCGKVKCREETIKKSYELCIRSLLLDSGNGFYLPPNMYYSFLDKVGEKDSCVKYTRMKCIHDSIVLTMMKHCLGSGSEECYTIPLHTILDSYYITYNDIMRGDVGKKQIIYIPLQKDMFTVSPPSSSSSTKLTPTNVFSSGWVQQQQQPPPAWDFALCSPTITPQTQDSVNENNQPIPMEY